MVDGATQTVKKEVMKVIFLDIDGVMNSNVYYHKRYHKLSSRLSRIYHRNMGNIKYVLNGFKQPVYKHKTHPNWGKPVYVYERLIEETCPQKWEWLRDWCYENDYKIVISSTWRNLLNKKESWDDVFKLLGFNPGTCVGRTKNRETLRGEEIQDWLDNHSEVIDYAILDDDSDMLENQFCKFHHCDPYFGLTPNHLYRIDKQFNNNTDYERLTKTL